MKTVKNKKTGISLIVLVITIIVMIILATAVVLTLSNSGIIGKANEAVNATDLANVQDLATMLWAEAYLDPNIKNDAGKIKAYIETGLDNAKIDKTKYNLDVTLSGVTVTKAGEQSSGTPVPEDWKENVVAIVDEDVPIPKGFVASPYGADEANGIAAENTKAGGLVIYELNDKDITKEDQFTAWTTRNQYVWIPVDKNKFEEQFVRTGFLGESVVTAEGKYNALGTSGVYWEVIIDEATKLPKTTLAEQSETFMSPETLTEVQAMYASVKKYGGFYIARYEAGVDDANWRTSSSTAIVETLTNVHSKMNKIPYNNIKWSSSSTMKVDTGGAVQVARSLYTSKTTDANYSKYGVVSTLTYGVQWDRVIDWYVSTGAMSEAEVTKTTGSTSKGNYKDHDIASYTELNKDARFTTSGTTAFGPVTDKYTKGSSTTDVAHILTTGALKAAKINNIYDMAGNMYEWTMEGNATGSRVLRGGSYSGNGADVPVSYRYSNHPLDGYVNDGFRSSLYIK